MTTSKTANVAKLVKKVTKRKFKGQLGCADGGVGGDTCRAN
jgi:hypothetical protein